MEPALGLGDPHWADDAGFDVARHVHALRLAAPAGAAELRDLAGVLLAGPLDPVRPLWRMTLVTGLQGGGFALIGQAHHALVDGVAALEVAALVLDPAARARCARAAPRAALDAGGAAVLRPEPSGTPCAGASAAAPQRRAPCPTPPAWRAPPERSSCRPRRRASSAR